MKKYIVRIMLGLLITSILAVPNAAAEVPVPEPVMIDEGMTGSDSMYLDMEMDFA